MQAVDLCSIGSTPDTEIAGDLASYTFVESTVELMAMSNDELRSRIPEFGFALSAIITRVAQLGECAQ